MPNNTTSLDMDAMSTDEKLEEIKMLRELINRKEKASNERGGAGETFPNIAVNNKKSFISGTVMSVVFLTCFLMIVVMAAYSFHTLYIAIQKKYPSKHTEL